MRDRPRRHGRWLDLARDPRLDRDVAIKVLPEHLAADADRLGRFQREAKVLASLNHTSIAAIYGSEEFGGKQYLVLEYVKGSSLQARPPGTGAAATRRGPCSSAC